MNLYTCNLSKVFAMNRFSVTLSVMINDERVHVKRINCNQNPTLLYVPIKLLPIVRRFEIIFTTFTLHYRKHEKLYENRNNYI